MLAGNSFWCLWSSKSWKSWLAGVVGAADTNLEWPLAVLSKVLWFCLLKGNVCCFTMGIFVVNLLCEVSLNLCS